MELRGYGSMDSERLDATFAALADPTRRAILARLTSGAATMSELASPFDMSQPAVSKHLKVLERVGLVSRGRPRRLEAGPLKAASDWLGSYRRFWTDREMVLTRVFDAPRGLVFDAFTQPDLLRRWFGARGWQLVVCEVDLRVGGAWRFVSRSQDGTEIGHGGVYREVVPSDRLVFTESYDDQWVPGQVMVTSSFVECAGRTTLTSTLRFDTKEIRDGVAESPMERGISEGHDRLADLLPRLRARETS